MEEGIYRYIVRHSLGRQVVLVALAACSFPFLYVFYELPKLIINDAIEAKGVAFPATIRGIELSQTDYLFLLSALFLVLVAVNQGFKYVINIYGGVTGERMLRRLRYDLYARVLRFPLPQFRKTSQGEIITMISAEVEPLGGFVGDSFKLPVFQGGYLVVILAFLFVQNWLVALAAVALYPLQLYLIPRLQRRVNLLGKERVRLVRRLSDRVGETVAGTLEIHAHDAARRELAEFSRRLGAIYEVRLRIYVWKFVIKFLNNSINQLGPFCFYAIGGWLAIRGELDVGTLLAAIAAHKDLAAPWKELLSFYQRQQDARIKFGQVIAQFGPPGMMDPALQAAGAAAPAPAAGAFSAVGVGVADDAGAKLVDGASFSFEATEHVALVGAGGSGKEELALLLARLLAPGSGTLRLGGVPMAELPESVTGRRLAYVGPSAFLFSTSIRDNLLYGVRHAPLRPAERGPGEAAAEARRAAEARAAGNAADDPDADWIDYGAVGADGPETLPGRMLEALALVGLDRDVFELGLRGRVDPAARPELAAGVLEARAAFRARLADPELAALVETFDPERYNDHMTLGENLLFGTPVGSVFDMDRLAENPRVVALVAREGLAGALFDAGRRVASTMIDIFADLPPDHPFFEQFSFISSEDLPRFRAVLARIDRDGAAALGPEERTMLLSLPFKLCPARHRLGIVDDDLRSRVLRAREAFMTGLPEAERGAIEFFDAGRFSAAASLRDNILFGTLAYGRAGGAERVGEVVAEVVDSLGLRGAVMEAGLDFQVGVGGGRLPAAQRQKLGIARAVLKRPDVLVLDEATAGLDGAAQAALLDGLTTAFAGRGLVWAVHKPSMAARFDRVIVMRSGRVVEQGTFAETAVAGSALRSLIDAE